jgi:hypothetical protein
MQTKSATTFSVFAPPNLALGEVQTLVELVKVPMQIKREESDRKSQGLALGGDGMDYRV